MAFGALLPRFNPLKQDAIALTEPRFDPRRQSWVAGAVDAATVQVILDLWRGLIARVQVVEEVNPMRLVIHPVAFTWETGGARALAFSPVGGSVLGDAVLAAGHLQRVVDGTSTDEVAELQVARDLMRQSLERTRKKEPCLLHFDL